eukprot:jgi/Chlat1/7407/Chrsp6S07485
MAVAAAAAGVSSSPSSSSGVLVSSSWPSLPATASGTVAAEARRTAAAGSTASRLLMPGLQIAGRRKGSPAPSIPRSKQRQRRRCSTITTLGLFGEEPPGSEQDHDAALWQRANLIKRQLQVAISDEDYAAAARLRDESETVEGAFTPQGKFMFSKVDELASGPTMDARREACTTLESIGDERALPALAALLRSADANTNILCEKAMWAIFGRSGRPEVDEALQRGIALMEIASQNRATLVRAQDAFGQVIQMAPSFAEAYNKRATVRYLLQEYEGSIEDCESTLALNPVHFGAWSGMGLCNVHLRRYARAQECFRRALEINPNMDQIRKYLRSLEVAIAQQQQQQGDQQQDQPPER